MAVIALCSASGSPGVTTTSVALAWNWHRPVMLVEADPVGGSAILAGTFRGMREYRAGLVELTTSNLDLGDALADVADPVEGTKISFVAGPRSHLQVPSLEPLWGRLMDALDELDDAGRDVIVDAGRLGMKGSPEPLLALADLTLIVTRTDLVSLSAVRTWAAALRDRTPAWRDAGLLLVGPGQPYSAKEVAKELGLPVVASVTDDAPAAAVFHAGAPAGRKWATGPYLRSVGATGEAITTLIARGRAELLQDVTP
jgi:cellulose biosynthesis protein BcsQ